MVLALCLSLRAQAFHSPARALEAELRPKLAHVRYGSREFDQVLKKTLPKYQVGVDRSVSVFQWRPNLGSLADPGRPDTAGISRTERGRVLGRRQFRLLAIAFRHERAVPRRVYRS